MWTCGCCGWQYTAAWIENILAEDNFINGTALGLRCKTSPETRGGARDIISRDWVLKNITNGKEQIEYILLSANVKTKYNAKEREAFE